MPPDRPQTLRLAAAAVVFAAAAALLFSSAVGKPLMVANFDTDSLPRGVYFRVLFAEPAPGKIIAFAPRGDALRHIRKIMPHQKRPLLKKIAAIHRGEVCWSDSAALLTVDGQKTAFPFADAAAVRADIKNTCAALSAGEMFVVGEHSASFDSRYFGIVTAGDWGGIFKKMPAESADRAAGEI